MAFGGLLKRHYLTAIVLQSSLVFRASGMGAWVWVGTALDGMDGRIRAADSFPLVSGYIWCRELLLILLAQYCRLTIISLHCSDG